MTPTQMTAAELDRDRLRDLGQLEHEDGVLTVMVGHDPSRPEESRAAEAALRSGLAEWRRSDDEEFVAKLNRRIEELDDDLEDLVDPSSPGRGRVLVTTLEPGADVHVLRLQEPLDHQVVVARHAWLRPLLSFAARMKPVRVIGLHRGGVRVHDWRLGQLTHRWDREVEFGDRHLADVKSGPSNVPHQRGYVNKERFEDRLDANRARMLRASVTEAVDAARQAGIDRFLLSGSPRLRQDVLGELDTDHLDIWTDDHDLAQADEEEVRRLVVRHADEAFVRRSEELVEAINDAVGSGLNGVTDLAGVLGALNEGRVQTLVVATNESPDGYLLPDGRLSLHRQGGEPEPFLLDRAMAAALMTDAEVVPVDESYAHRLGSEGIGALLRW